MTKNLVPNRGIRIEDELYLKIIAIANIEERSTNKQIVLILKSYVADYELKNGVIKVDTDELYK